MDQKQLSQLDPKLKAVYDRVMGVANAAPPPPASQAPQTPPPPVPLVTPFVKTTEPSSLPPMPTPVPPAQPPTPPQEPVPSYPESNQPMQQVYSTMPLDPMSRPIVTQNSSSKTFMILFIILGIIFFILYGVFWVQLFHIGIPGFS